jgi:hypothetical protein
VTTVYVGIGNTDGRLSHREWSEFCRWVAELLDPEETKLTTAVHGAWYSLPAQPYVNACWCVEVPHQAAADALRDALDVLRERYRQDSVKWDVVPEPEFLTAAEFRHASPGCACGVNGAGDPYVDPICVAADA